MGDDFPYDVIEVVGGECGRAAVASRTLQPGQLVLSERALVCVTVAGRSLCNDCLEPVRDGSQCDGCRTEVDNSTVHSSASLPVRLSAKLLLRKLAGLLGRDQAVALEGLIYHEQQQDDDVFQIIELAVREKTTTYSVEKSAQMLSDRFGVHGGAPAVLRQAKEEFGRVSLNAINTCDGEGATGLGLFPSAAMFNHSCCPNVQAWWRGSKLELRCTKRVAAGEELRISYISVDQPSTLRRAQLRSNWLFTCLCPRCVSGQWDIELVGFRCPSASCSGAVPPPWSGIRPACNQCGRVPVVFTEWKEFRGDGRPESTTLPSIASTDTSREQLNLSRRLLDAQRNFDDGVKAYMREDPETALVELEKCLASREDLLHAFNKDLLRTLRYASYASVATHSWSKAHSYLVRWLHAMNAMFGAAEVWDIAVMHVDIGLVLEKLAASRTPIPETETLPLARFEASRQYEASDLDRGAVAHIKEGLRWIWICLGKGSDLPAESSALEALSKYSISV